MSYNLQDESEVKEYIENLGIEYRFGCYHEKKPEVCHLLGDYLEAIKKDFEKSAKVYKNNCDDSKHGKSCYKFGNYMLLGKGIKKVEPEIALTYFERGCEAKDPDACLHAGLMRTSSTPFPNIEKRVEKGFKMLLDSCEGKNANACYYISGMYMTGFDGTDPNRKETGDNKNSNKKDFTIPKDMKKAFEFTQKACGHKNIYACANLSQMYKRGEGVEKNLELANKFKALSIEMQDELKKQQPQLVFQQ